LAQRIVDLDAADAEGGEDRGDGQDDRDQIRKAQRNEPNSLNIISEGMQMTPVVGCWRLFEERVQIFLRQDFSPGLGAAGRDRWQPAPHHESQEAGGIVA
jgi:hypothetical protein